MRRNRTLLAVAGVAIVLGLALLPYAWELRDRVSMEGLRDLAGALAEIGPLPFFALMCVAPLFGSPVSPFLLVAPAFGTQTAIVGCFAALTGNLALSWLVSAKLFRPFFERLLARFGYSIPELSSANMLGMALMLRMTPGIPMAALNYLLGVARMPFTAYMLVSVPLVCATSAGIVILGDALMKGSAAAALGGLFVLISVALIVRSVRLRMRERKLVEDLDGPV